MSTDNDSDLEQRIATALTERAETLDAPSESRHLIGDSLTRLPFVEHVFPPSRSRRRLLVAAAAIVITALVATVGVFAYSRRSHPGGSSVEAAQPIAPTGTTIDKSPRGGTPCDCILTPADLAAQDRRDAAFFARRDAFIKNFATTNFDPGTLPRSEIAADLLAPPRTLQLAAAQAVAIVEGTINALHFTPNGTTADVAITAVGKGSFVPGNIVPVELGFQLEPNPSFTGAELGVTPTSPVLLPHGHAVFLLSRTSDGKWWADTGAQAFAVANGKVVSPPGSTPFRQEVNGLTPTEFLNATK